jgi:hypothetical protein
MTALVRMRLAAFVRSGRALPPIIAALAVLAVIYGGGSSLPGPAFGYSAVMLFPVLAWLTKLVLDAEPEVQRRLARLTVGSGRELAAGLFAATVIGLVLCAVAMLAPWPFGAIRGPEPGEPAMATGVLLGALAHLLALCAAIALGALASRAVTRGIRNGVTVLVTGSVLVVVLGLSGSIAPWLVPPVMAMARALSRTTLPPGGAFWLLAAWAAAWCATVLAIYGWLRRRRS